MIRKIEKQDIEQVTLILKQYKISQNKPLSERDLSQIMIQFKLICQEDNKFCYVYEDKDEILGYINTHLCLFPMIAGAELYVSDLLVRDEYRGRGIGRKLLQKAEGIAEENNCVRLMLNNLKDAASYEKGFYIKNGYVERKNIANFVKSVDDE